MEKFEQWKPIPGYEGLYDVSDMGRVRSLRMRLYHHDSLRKVPLILSPGLRMGYPFVRLHDTAREEKPKSFSVHRLVCEAFHGPCPDGHQCAHLNGDRNDPRAENLSWVLPAENQSHRLIHGTDSCGENQYSAILSEESVLQMRREFVGRRGQLKDWALEYGCTISAIWRAVHGKSWRHLNG